MEGLIGCHVTSEKKDRERERDNSLVVTSTGFRIGQSRCQVLDLPSWMPLNKILGRKLGNIC